MAPGDAVTGAGVHPRGHRERDEPDRRTDARDPDEAGADLDGRDDGLGGGEHETSWDEAISEV